MRRRLCKIICDDGETLIQVVVANQDYVRDVPVTYIILTWRLFLVLLEHCLNVKRTHLYSIMHTYSDINKHNITHKNTSIRIGCIIDETQLIKCIDGLSVFLSRWSHGLNLIYMAIVDKCARWFIWCNNNVGGKFFFKIKMA